MQSSTHTDTTAGLAEQVANLLELCGQQRQQIEQLMQHVAKLERIVFGKKSEHVEPVRDEVERELGKEEVEVVARRLAGESNRAEPNRDDLRKAARVVGRQKSEPAREQKRKSRLESDRIIERVVEVTPDDLPEGTTLAEFEPLGSADVTVRVTHVQGHLLLTRYVLPKLQHKEQSNLIISAAAPDTTPLEGGRYEAPVYSAVVTARVLDNMPINRLARSWSRDGYPMAPSVLIGLFHQAAFLFTPIYQRLVKELQTAQYVCADETPQPMLDPGKGKTTRGWMWMGLCNSVIAYRFDTSRSAEAGKVLLGTSLKNLMVDGYSGYSDVAIDGGRSACWTHGRRGIFVLRENWATGDKILGLIQQLYRVEIETRINDPSDEALLAARQLRSVAIVDEIFRIAEAEYVILSPSSEHAKALKYLLNRKSELRRFLDDPQIPLDNNISERALRTVAQGRKSSLFVGPGNNGQDLAILLTILRTCELHQVNPVDYMNDVLVRLRKLGWRKDKPEDARAEFDELTPARWKAARAKDKSAAA